MSLTDHQVRDRRDHRQDGPRGEPGQVEPGEVGRSDDVGDGPFRDTPDRGRGLLAGFLAVTWPLVRMMWHALHHEGDLAWLGMIVKWPISSTPARERA